MRRRRSTRSAPRARARAGPPRSAPRSRTPSRTRWESRSRRSRSAPSGSGILPGGLDDRTRYGRNVYRITMMRESSEPVAVERLPEAPLADRARTAILQAILSKQFIGRLPPEEMLAEMLDVSRTTIRSALQSLEQDGIITRKRALGTTINAHVRPSTLALQRLVGFDGLLREEGYEVRTQVSWS